MCTAFLLHERLAQDTLLSFENTDVAETVASHVAGEDSCADPPARWPRGGVRAGLGIGSAAIRFISGDAGELVHPGSAPDSSRGGCRQAQVNGSLHAQVFGQSEAAFAMVARLPQQLERKQVGGAPQPLGTRVAIELLEASNGWFRFITEQPPAPDPETLFAVDKCVLMWGFDTSPTWGGRLQPMTLTGNYRDSQDAILGVFEQLAKHVSAPVREQLHAGLAKAATIGADSPAGDEIQGADTFRPPLLLPGRYSTGAPWAAATDDIEDCGFEKPRRPHENVCSPRGRSFGIEVKLDGTVFVFGPEGEISLEQLLGKLMPPPPVEAAGV